MSFLRFSVVLGAMLLPALGLGQRKKLEYTGFFDSYYYRGPIQFTAGLGTSFYGGDLSKSYYAFAPGFYAAGGANYKVWSRVVFGGELFYLTLHGNDYLTTRKLSFRSNGYGLDLYGRLYLLDDIVRVAADRSRGKRFMRCYIHSGLGLYRLKSATTDSLDQPNSEGKRYPTIANNIPLGIGLSFRVNPRLSILAEISHRFVLSDWLDATSHRGSERTQDRYGYISVKAEFNFWEPMKKKKAPGVAPEPNANKPTGGGRPKPEKKKPEPPVQETPSETPPEDAPQEAPPEDNPPQDNPAPTPTPGE